MSKNANKFIINQLPSILKILDGPHKFLFVYWLKNKIK